MWRERALQHARAVTQVTAMRQSIAAGTAQAHLSRRARLWLIGRAARNLSNPAAMRGTVLASLSGMKLNRLPTDWIPTLLLPMAALAQAPSPQPLDVVRRVAEEFVVAQVPAGEARVHASAEALDPRLRLPLCEGKPAGHLPQAASFGARVSVGVSCAAPRWTVYVPVRVETEMPVLVLRNALPRNAAVGAADVEIRTQRVPGLATSYIGRVEELSGRHLKRPVPAGTALTVDLLAADILVRRGQRVTLVAQAGGLEVRAQGEAIQDATPDGRVRVLNLASRKVVEGQVESRDLVRVSL